MVNHPLLPFLSSIKLQSFTLSITLSLVPSCSVLISSDLKFGSLLKSTSLSNVVQDAPILSSVQRKIMKTHLLNNLLESRFSKRDLRIVQQINPCYGEHDICRKLDFIKVSHVPSEIIQISNEF